ncbi:phage tail terminator family protein [Clostridium massiliodielmoense]|uniref:phage tail terminator family protein n=1 Tax=Clostridium massiliodielmoense TaxID=1776385 RepID=UPI000A26C8DA|nr:hypothetical protein [Clostridium massiliodielmoense]
MIKLTDLKQSINLLLENTGVKTMDNSEREGFRRPFFFIEIVPIEVKLFKVNKTENKYMIVINYFSKEETQLENLKMVDTIKEKILPYICVKERKLVPKKIQSEAKDNMLSINFILEWFDDLDANQEEYELMQELDIK